MNNTTNRRNFLTTLGAAVVALPVLSQMAKTEIVEETDDFFNGLFINEPAQCCDIFEDEWSYFFTLRQHADDSDPRIVSTVRRKIPNRKTIDFTYLEPTSEPFPETDDDE